MLILEITHTYKINDKTLRHEDVSAEYYFLLKPGIESKIHLSSGL